MVMDVSAVAVVDGATVVIGAACIAAIVGVSAMRSCHWSHPRPSITRRTTCRATPTSAGIQVGNGTPRGASRAGTMPRTLAPEYAGRTGGSITLLPVHHQRE